MKVKTKHIGHTLAETRAILDKAIDESAERLRRRLRTAWKRQAVAKHQGRYEAVV